jgi:peptidoglycan DL-endopeptidase CwlO
LVLPLRYREEKVLKKKIITLSTTIMLGMGGIFTVPAVKAETSTSIQTSINQAQQELNSLQTKRAELEAQIQRLEQAINDNNVKMEQTNLEISAAQTEVEKFNNEIAVIQERITQRNNVLKERAVSFQESGGQISYLDVILGSSSFGDFIDRVGAVATIVDADKILLQEHEADKQELKEKQSSVENKLTELNNMKTELEGMQAGTEEQKAQIETLKQNVLQDEQQASSELASYQQQQKAELEAAQALARSNSNNSVASTTPSGTTEQKSTLKNSAAQSSSAPSLAPAPAPSGNISAAINAGYKYIGNSVYVFGGGRSASDIANGRFDCSGFVSWAFSQAGIKVGASTDSLKNTGTRVSVSDIQPGDMVFFNTYKTDGHVGIYIGGGKFIGSQSSTGVAVANMTSGYWAGVFNGRVMRVR